MKTNFDFLDTGSYVYILIAVGILVFVVWTFLYEAIKPLLAVIRKPKATSKQSMRPETQHQPKQFGFEDKAIKTG